MTVGNPRGRRKIDLLTLNVKLALRADLFPPPPSLKVNPIKGYVFLLTTVYNDPWICIDTVHVKHENIIITYIPSVDAHTICIHNLPSKTRIILPFYRCDHRVYNKYDICTCKSQLYDSDSKFILVTAAFPFLV